MRGLLLLFGRLILFPQFFDEQPHMFRSGIRKRIFAAEIEIIPEPLPIIGVARNGNRPQFKDGFIGRCNIGRD